LNENGIIKKKQQEVQQEDCFFDHAFVRILKGFSLIFTEGSKTKCFKKQKHLVFVLF